MTISSRKGDEKKTVTNKKSEKNIIRIISKQQ